MRCDASLGEFGLDGSPGAGETSSLRSFVLAAAVGEIFVLLVGSPEVKGMSFCCSFLSSNSQILGRLGADPGLDTIVFLRVACAVALLKTVCLV